MEDKRKTICVVTSNRADWSKLRPVATKLADRTKRIRVEVIALGSHMLYELGDTKKIVRSDFPDAHELHTLVAGDCTESMTDSVGFGIIKLTSLLTRIQPNLVLLHGDRFDAFCAAVAANMLNITVAHIEGGELSGTVDGTLRHAVTKLSHIHFACTADAARRIRAMGENPCDVHVTGCPSYDSLFSLPDSCWQDEEMDEFFAGGSFRVLPGKFILALMHPVTNDLRGSQSAYDCLMSALFDRKVSTVLFYPNIDPGNKTMIQTIHKYQKMDPGWMSWLRLVTHVTPARFMTLMKNSLAMVGNSSAGIRESCVFGTPTLNLGSRQIGRLAPHNVTTLTEPTKGEIVVWLEQHCGKRYEPSKLYGKPNSSQQIADIISGVVTEVGLVKKFWEPSFSLLAPPPRSIPSNHQTLLPAITDGPRLAPVILGLITARGGSKGIPGKNIVDLHGKPLIQYTIDAAIGAQKLDRVVLSTDCEKIAGVARRLGCEVPFQRPAELAEDDSSHMDCIIHALDTLRTEQGYLPDYVMILQPTSPFRTSADIDNSIAIMTNTSCDLVVSVNKVGVQLSKTFYLADGNRLHPFAESTSEHSYIRRQSLPETFCENGAIYLQRASTLYNPPLHRPNFGSFRSEDARGYIMPHHRSIDIDTTFDLHLAKLLMASPFPDQGDDDR